MSVETPVRYEPSPLLETPPPSRRRPYLLVGIIALVIVVVAAVVGVVLATRSSGPPAPVGLHVVSTSATAVSFDWSPGSTKIPGYYVVYRDGVRVATLLGQDSQYISTSLTPATTYRFAVTAKDGDRESDRTPALVVTTLAGPATPVGVHLVKKTSSSITIGWDRTSAQRPESYSVYRDGTQVVTLAGGRLRYADTALRPDTAYRYQVSASANGLESDLSPAVVVRTKVATLADAQLASSYNVRVRITSESGYTELSPGEAQTVTWWFSQGVNGTATLNGNTWSSGGWTMTLHQHGRTYTGQTVEGISSCMGVPVDTTVRVSITVLRAGMSGGAWTARAFSGRLTQNAPYTTSGTFVCPGAQFAAAVHGRISG